MAGSIFPLCRVTETLLQKKLNTKTIKSLGYIDILKKGIS